MPATKATSRKTIKITTSKLPKISFSKTYTEEERKQDEKICLSRMKEKSLSQAEFDAAFRKAFGV